MHPTHANLQWNILIVKPNTENKTRQQLARIGYEACVPMQRQLRQWSDRKKWVDVVLFRNYVFVQLDSKGRDQVRDEKIGLRFVQFDKKFAALTESEVALIKGLHGIQAPVQIHCSEAPGTGAEVEILRGSLIGQRGFVVAVNGKTRLRIDLASMGCFAEVELSAADVRVLSLQSPADTERHRNGPFASH
jgi:transcription antitermination factor NusG